MTVTLQPSPDPSSTGLPVPRSRHRHPSFPIRALSMGAVAAMIAGCTGVITDPRGDEETPAAADPRSLCETSSVVRPDIAERRLTSEELVQTYEALLGSEFVAGSRSILDQLPSDRLYESPGELQPLHTQAHSDAALSLAIDLAERLGVSPENRRALGAECVDDPNGELCARSLLDSFGARATRRPLTDAEKERLLGDFLTDGDDGFIILVARLLSSPGLMFHHWSSPPTPYDVASRAAYITTGGPPDERLWDAASRGELDTMPKLRAEVERLLDSPAGRQRMVEFFRYWLRLEAVPVPSARASERLGLDPGALRQAALSEVDRYIEQMVFARSAEFRELITSPLVYPEDDGLAELYGTPVWQEGDAPIEAPHHRGLLGRVALLLSEADRTSPIMRGIRLRARLLCQEIAPPDTETIDTRVDDLGEIDRTEYSNREATEQLTGVSPCSSCHQTINPPGFVFEAFDSLGAYRTTEVVYDEEGRELARHPIDTVVDDLRIGSEVTPASSFDDIVDLVGDQPLAHACVAKSVVEFFFADEAPGECGAADVAEAVGAGASFVDVVVGAIVTEEMLR